MITDTTKREVMQQLDGKALVFSLKKWMER
jgi:hypothetical protein